MTKLSIDTSGINSITKKRFENTSEDVNLFARGIAGDPLKESIPQLIKSTNEKVIGGSNGSEIVLGRDRPRSRLSGYGGQGHTKSAMIDIVVGRMGNDSKEFSASGKRIWVNPDFGKDSARIYISQKTDIDENFLLAKGTVGNSKSRSSIGIKADGVRIIAREGIKLVTGTDRKNSQGGNIETIRGIDIIAGNNDKELQPMVRGNNVAEALSRIVFHIDKLNGIVDSLLMAQMTFNTALSSHFHFSPFFGLPTTPSPPVVAAGMKTMVEHLTQTKRSLITHKVNLGMFKLNYLSQAGSKYINSRWNNVN